MAPISKLFLKVQMVNISGFAGISFLPQIVDSAVVELSTKVTVDNIQAMGMAVFQ